MQSNTKQRQRIPVSDKEIAVLIRESGPGAELELGFGSGGAWVEYDPEAGPSVTLLRLARLRGVALTPAQRERLDAAATHPVSPSPS